jgi:nitrogen regulatory protein PII
MLKVVLPPSASTNTLKPMQAKNLSTGAAMFMILCVVDDPEKLSDVLDAWQAIGVNGVTILESSGLHRHHQIPWIPMRYGFTAAGADRSNVTLISVVEQDAMIQRCLEATEEVLGDLDGPNTGIFVAVPVAMAKGTSGKKQQTNDPKSPGGSQ